MLKKLLLLACTACTLSACNDDGTKHTGLPYDYVWAQHNDCIENGRFTGRNMHFYGRATVVGAGGATYVDDKAHFEFAGSSDEFVLYMHQTRFAAEMPPVEMRIPGVPYEGSGRTIAFAAERIVPEAYIANMGYTSMERYVITDLEGSVDDIDCRVEFTCAGIYRMAFEGRQIVDPDKR